MENCLKTIFKNMDVHVCEYYARFVLNLFMSIFRYLFTSVTGIDSLQRKIKARI